MAQHISQQLDKSQIPKLTLLEVLESYSHIELTEDEKLEGLIWRKIKKEGELKALAQKEKEEQNRKRFSQTTNYEIVRSLMLYRTEQKFNKRLVLDEDNKIVFEILCRYFGNDAQFVSLSKSVAVENPSLDKGVLLAGNFGVGKTWLMELFQQNQRQVYFIRNAKNIADEFMTFGEQKMDEYIDLIKNPINDSSTFYQKYSGLCLDDIGTEDIKTHFGNKKNVIGDLIEKKYSNQTTGVFLHGTTNLTGEQLKEFYGGRVVSRMREIFNFIELKGSDRRK